MFRLFKLTYSVIILLCFSFVSCKSKHDFKKNDLVSDVAKMNDKVKTNIEIIIAAAGTDQQLQDSTKLHYYNALKYIYLQNKNESFWSSKEQWTDNAAKLLGYIDTAAMNGLYKEDYHYTNIKRLKSILETDSVTKMDAVMWANADVLFSDAFAAILKDLKQGRLVNDSTSFKIDTAKFSSFFQINFQKLKDGENLTDILADAEPKNKDYKILKTAIKKFVDSMDSKVYTYLNYPAKDSLAFVKLFKK